MTKKTSPKVRSPFDLPKVAARFPVYVGKRVAAVMELPDEENGSEAEREAIHLIYPALSQQPDGRWAFTIPHHYGLKDRERQFVESAYATDVEFQARSYELIEKIADETGTPLMDLLQKAQRDPNGFSQDPLLAPYTGELVRLAADQAKEVPLEKLVATAHMMRTISGWELKHTIALHPRIYDQLLDFAAQEKELALMDDDDEGEALEASTSAPESINSEATSHLTGTPLDTISVTGE